MNLIHRNWVLSQPEETRKFEKNAKKLFPEETHVGRFMTCGLGLKVVALNKSMTITKRKATT